ncbi:MAG TPA: riboflavin synthase [Methylocella sp.]|nr:riboflavin synthase [Methylocella sp.]
MFTGIISDVGDVQCIQEEKNLRRLRIGCSYPAESIAVGASIACGGPCLTVTASGLSGPRSYFEVDVGAETLARTTARHWQVGTRLNLERPLRIGDELGGHIVTGHIDAVGKIAAIADFDGMRRVEVIAPADISRLIAEKGSISLDGTSLTVNSVEADFFEVLLVPHTLKATTWSDRHAGDDVNLEIDLMARYAARLLNRQPG